MFFNIYCFNDEEENGFIYICSKLLFTKHNYKDLWFYVTHNYCTYCSAAINKYKTE